MKKLFALIAMVGLGIGSLSAQCSPDPQYTSPGIYPTPVQIGLISVPVNMAWQQTLTINVPADTTIDLSAIIGFPVPPVNVTVNYQEITGVNGLPPGTASTCNPVGCSWNGGTSGCIDLSGTPTTTGQYTFAVTGNLNITVPITVPVIGGSAQDIPTPLAYQMEVTGANAIDLSTVNGFAVDQNAPNPFNGQTSIEVYLPYAADLEMEIFDLNGKVIQEKRFEDVSGLQKLMVDASGLTPGVYFYRIGNGEEQVVKKMIIAE